jgi:hypothetical protein
MIPHQIVTAVTTASYPPKGRSTNLAQVYKLEEGVQAQKSQLKLPSPARPTAEAVVRKTPLGPKCRGVKTLTASGKKYRF